VTSQRGAGKCVASIDFGAKRGARMRSVRNHRAKNGRQLIVSRRDVAGARIIFITSGGTLCMGITHSGETVRIALRIIGIRRVTRHWHTRTREFRNLYLYRLFVRTTCNCLLILFVDISRSKTFGSITTSVYYTFQYGPFFFVSLAAIITAHA